MLSSLEIDEAVRESVRDGRSLYSVDAELIAALAPDLIVTQDLCAVCAVSSGELATACPVGAEVLSLDPRTLARRQRLGRDPRRPARRDRARRGDRGGRCGRRSRRLRPSVRGLPRRRVFFAEWIDPPFCAGHWLPEMIELAGGSRRARPRRRAFVPDDVGRGDRAASPSSW